jgi:hypothetical protein
MMLLTKALRQRLPQLYAQDGDPHAKAYVKFFTPDGAATWYVSEFDGVDTCFGWADLGLGPGCAGLGYFSLSELEALRGPLGLPVERDRGFRPTRLTTLIAA